jgi:hypothetical protein
MLNSLIPNATPTATRFRMSAASPASVAGVSVEGRRGDAAIAFGYGTAAPATTKDAVLGVRAWSPPV